MKVLVCGGRDFNDYKLLNKTLNRVHKHLKISLLIEGGAKGADSLAATWAKENNIPIKTFKADWNKFKKSAGPIRNQQMINGGLPELVVAFGGGSGTADMIRRAKKANIVVMEII